MKSLCMIMLLFIHSFNPFALTANYYTHSKQYDSLDSCTPLYISLFLVINHSIFDDRFMPNVTLLSILFTSVHAS